MNKKLLYVLIIMALSVLVLIANTGKMTLDLFFFDIRTLKAIIFLSFIGVGVVIGVLMK